MELVQAAATLPGPLPVLLPAGTLEVQRQQLCPRLGDWNLGRRHQTGDKIALPIAKMGGAHSEGGNGTAGRHPAPAVLVAQRAALTREAGVPSITAAARGQFLSQRICRSGNYGFVAAAVCARASK